MRLFNEVADQKRSATFAILLLKSCSRIGFKNQKLRDQMLHAYEFHLLLTQSQEASDSPID